MFLFSLPPCRFKEEGLEKRMGNGVKDGEIERWGLRNIECTSFGTGRDGMKSRFLFFLLVCLDLCPNSDPPDLDTMLHEPRTL